MPSISYLGDRRRLALDRDDVDHAAALQHVQPLARIEPRETVAGKERPVDLLLPVLPAAPPRHRRQERFDRLLLELCAHHLFVTRLGPDREPRDRTVAGRRCLGGRRSCVTGAMPARLGGERPWRRGSACAACRAPARRPSSARRCARSPWPARGAGRGTSAVSAWRFCSPTLLPISLRACSNVFTRVSVLRLDLEQLIAALRARAVR